MFIRNNFEYQYWSQPSTIKEADKYCFKINKKCYPIETTINTTKRLKTHDDDHHHHHASSLLFKTTTGCCMGAFSKSQRSSISSTTSSLFSFRSNQLINNQSISQQSIRSSLRLNKTILQQNRILINYKKLTQFENFFAKNFLFLKKNFEIIHSYLKDSTEKCDLKLIESSDLNYQAVKLRSKSNFDFTQSTQRRAFSEPVNLFPNHRHSFSHLNPVEKKKLLFRYSNSNNNNNTNNTRSDFHNELHFKLLLNSLCERNKRLFNDFEIISLMKPNEYLENIDFSKSMIKITICLRKILNRIDQVTYHT